VVCSARTHGTTCHASVASIKDGAVEVTELPTEAQETSAVPTAACTTIAQAVAVAEDAVFISVATRLTALTKVTLAAVGAKAVLIAADIVG